MLQTAGNILAAVVFGGGLILYSLFLLGLAVEFLHGIIKACGMSLYEEGR